MEKEELKRRLVKLKKDLAEKKRKLQKCERLSKARSHVQQKIQEQAYMLENDSMHSNGFSGHIPTKVTFEKHYKDEVGLCSGQDQRKKISGCDQGPMSVIHKHELSATEETSTCCSPPATANLAVRGYCLNKVSQRSTILNDSQQFVLPVDKNDNERASSECFNSTYTIKSRGNWVNGQSLVTDDSCTRAHSQDSCSSDSDINQNVNRTNRIHHTSKEKHKSLPSLVSKNGSGAAKSESSCESCTLCQHSCDGAKESSGLQQSPRHLSEGYFLESLGNGETCSDSRTPSPTGLFPNTEICNDTKDQLLAGDCQTDTNETKRCTTHQPINEIHENKKRIDPAVKKSNVASDWLLFNENDSSENIQDVAFIVDPDCHSVDPGQCQNDQSGNKCNDSELSTVVTEDKNLTVEEDKENIKLMRHLASPSSGDNSPNNLSVNKENKSVKSHRRYSDADLLDISFCEWEEDMYSQVKSRKNRRERLLSVPGEKLVLSQSEMVSTLLSQTDNSSEDTKLNCDNRTTKNRMSKTARRGKRVTNTDCGKHLKRTSRKGDTCLINDAFLKMLPEIETHVLEFFLPENEFGELLAAKLNNSKTLTCASSQSAAKRQEHIEELHPLDCDYDCYVQHVRDEDSKDPQDNSAQNSWEMLGYDSNEVDTNGGSSSLSQDSSILSSDRTKELFSYYGSIKLEHSEPLLSLWCDINEKFKPHEVMVACTPFRVMVWLRRGCGWRLTNVWTLEQLEAECILSCHISTCHRWVFIWTTVQCSTRLTAACIEPSNRLLMVLWATKLLFTHSQKHYSYKLNTAEFLIGSVMPTDQTQLMKVMLNEHNGTVVVDGAVKSVELDAAQEQLMSVVPIEGLPEALLGTTSTMFYIWNHVSGRLVHRVAIGQELTSCPMVYHHQGILLMAVITKSNTMGCLLAVNPTTSRTSILCTLETTPKDTNVILASLQSNGKLLCGQGNDNSLWLWCACSGKLISYSCKRPSIVSVHLCQERLLIVIKNTIHVYCFKT